MEQQGPAWAKRMFAVTLFVDDLEEAQRFYAAVFGMPVVHRDPTSCALQFPGLIINLLTVRAAPTLIEPAPVGPAGTPARMMLTLEVDDVDAIAERLRGEGVAFLNGPLDRPWGPHTLTFADPSGHCWELSS